MAMLDNLINDYIFDAQEKGRKFSENKEDLKFLLSVLKKEGFNVLAVRQIGYFYCEMSKGNFEVDSDSRDIFRPRNMREAICVAALKLYMPNTKSAWVSLAKSLDLPDSVVSKIN